MLYRASPAAPCRIATPCHDPDIGYRIWKHQGLHTPTSGRFAYAPAMADAREFSALHNSYGVLRAPWNNDPTPFMTRHENVYGFFNNLKPSGCYEYSTSIKKDNW